jgi:hypothetical protein
MIFICEYYSPEAGLQINKIQIFTLKRSLSALYCFNNLLTLTKNALFLYKSSIKFNTSFYRFHCKL